MKYKDNLFLYSKVVYKQSPDYVKSLPHIIIHFITTCFCPQAEIVDGFYPWAEGVPCPDQLCPLLGRRHYHCAHPRCLYVTAHADVLPLHAHDFHENTPIPEGFIAIDRNIDCRSPNCQR